MPTLQPGSTSQYFDVDIGQTVTVTPGGTMLVEYTTDDEPTIRNGSATWQAWTLGAVSSATSDVCMFPMFVRVTAYTSAGSYEVKGSGRQDMLSDSVTWKSDVVSARNAASAAAVVGAAKNIWLPVSETYGSRTITNAGPIVMASATIPPLTANGRIRVSGMFQMDTTSHTRTVTCKFGDQTFASTTYTAQAGIVTNPFRFELANYLSTAAQKSPGSFFNQSATGSALLDGTVNTTVEQTLEIVGTVATYAMTLLWLNIETCNRA